MTKSTNNATLADEDSLESQFGEGATKVQLRRWEVNEWVFLGELPAIDATAPKIQETYGGGKYRVRVYGADDKWTGKQFSFKIAGEPKTPGSSATPAAATAPAPAGATTATDELKKMIESLSSGNDIAKIALAAALRPPPVPVRDPLLDTLLASILERRGDGTDPLELQRLLQAAEERGERRGRELGELAAGAAGEGGIAGVLASHLPSIAESFSKAVATARGVPVTPAAPAPRAAPTAPPVHTIVTGSNGTSVPPVLPNPEEDMSNKPAWLPYLRPMVPVLLSYQRAGRDAQIKAANMIDDLSEENRRLIGTLAEEENFVDQVITHIPEFQTAPEVKEWFTIFFSTVQDMLTAPDDDDTGAE